MIFNKTSCVIMRLLDVVCYTKYDYKEIIEGKTLDQWKEEGKGITITWD